MIHRFIILHVYCTIYLVQVFCIYCVAFNLEMFIGNAVTVKRCLLLVHI